MSLGRYIDDFAVGDTWRSQGRTITDADLVQFTGLSWDTNPAHNDEEYCRTTPFGRRIAHGALTLAYATGLLARSGWFDETALAFLQIERWEFRAPVFVGDTIRLTARTLEARVSRSRPDRGPWTGHLEVRKQDGSIVQEGTFTIMMRARVQGGV